MSRPSMVSYSKIRILERGGTAKWLRARSTGPVYYTWRIAAALARRWRFTAPALFFWFLWGSADLATAVLLFGVSAALCVAAWLGWRNRGDEVSAGSVRSVSASLEDMRAKAALRKQWPLACESTKLLGARDGEALRLARVTSNGRGSYTARVESGKVGVPPSRIVKAAPDLADVVGCHEVAVTDAGKGVAELTFHWKDPLGRVWTLADLPIAPPGRIVYGVRQDGSPATINPMQSLLTGGLTRHGKSNIIWALLGDLVRQGIPTDLYVSDPKEGLELQVIQRALEKLGQYHDGVIRIRSYADSPKATAEMVVAAEKGCTVRKRELRIDGVRKLEKPTRDNPLVVVILDEMLVLEEMLKKGTNSPLGRLYFMGATAGYVIWGNSQAGTLDILGELRKYIPQRICVATDAPGTTDSFLGQYAESKGARCSEITEPGVGYSIEEGDRAPRKFKAALVADAETELIAEGRLPASVVNAAREAYDRRAEEEASTASKSRKDRRTALYRWFYIGHEEYGDSLGYVGISYDVIQRESQHNAAMREFLEGDVRREVEWFPSRPAAEAAEKAAIESEHPIHNKVYNGRGKRNWRKPQERELVG